MPLSHPTPIVAPSSTATTTDVATAQPFNMPLRILVGSYSRSVSTLAFNPNTRTLTLVSSTEVGHHPSWLAQHPVDPSLVYTGLEQSDGRMLALRIDKEGSATIMAESTAGGKDPASFIALANEVIVGNYSSGTVAVLPTTAGASPSIAPAPSATYTLPFVALGPNSERQESSHPHQVVFDATHGQLLVPDLGADRTWIFSRDASSKSWVRSGSLEYAPGAGPRHLVIHNDLVYTLCELTSTVTTHRLGNVQPISHVASMREPPIPLGDMLAAEITFYPPAPTSSEDISSYTPRLLYVANRNSPSEAGDPLAIFSLADPSRPVLVGEVKTGLRHTRGMVVSPDGRWVIAGGAKAGGAKVFEVVEDGAKLEEVTQCEIEAPTAFLWL